MKKTLALFLSIVMLIICTPVIFAIDWSKGDVEEVNSTLSQFNETIKSYLKWISESDKSYANCIDAEYVLISNLYTYDLNKVGSLLFGIYKDNKYMGYVIVRIDDKTVVESSCGQIPYNIDALQNVDNVKLVYDYGYEAVSINNNKPVFIYDVSPNLPENEFFASNNNTNEAYEPTAIVDGDIKIFKQVGPTCIPTSISHLLVYWNYNGYPGLTGIRGINSDVEFQNLVETVIKQFPGEPPLSYQTNNNIPKAFLNYSIYASLRVNKTYFIESKNVWNPNYSQVQAEIQAGRPLLLGFREGSDYGAHMTMCVGAATFSLPETDYVQIIDGRSTSVVTKIWSDYNDFICTVKVTMS